MINRLRTLQKGFTLVETLVAVLLLTVAIVGPLNIAARAFNAALVAKDQVVAYYLAQDVIEYVRFRRDSTCLANGTTQACRDAATSWLSAFGTNCNTSCKIDSAANTIASCVTTSATDCLMYYDNLNKRFTHVSTGNTPTRFKRFLRIDNAPTPQEALLTVTVAWTSSGGGTGTGCPTNTRCVILKEYMFNWQ